ncbi:MAG: hypothetical protein ABSG87_02135 [Verrucomicrobiota bacterium]|jgi:hypothetical protein
MIPAPCYTILSPGIVHYVPFDVVGKNAVEIAIAEIKQKLTNDSVVKMPRGTYRSPNAEDSFSQPMI